MYEKKPRSRVFAPLAETYRKLGMIDEAMKILNVGIKNHPSYTLGYIVLSHCYYDLQNYEMSYNVIRPFVSQNLENITLQKLFAKTCINLGYLEEALQTFKYLLLLNPKDSYVADQIKLLEDDLLVDQEIADTEIEVKNTESSFDEDEWVQVDFNKIESENATVLDKPVQIEEEVENWEVKNETSPLDLFKEEIQNNIIAVKEHNLDDEYFYEDFDVKANDVITADDTSGTKEEPLITHTLVDLYCKQGHLAKAASILENILELHPDDEATKTRLEEITMKLVGEVIEDEAVDQAPTQSETRGEQASKDFVMASMTSNNSELINQEDDEEIEKKNHNAKKIQKIKALYENYQEKLNLISKEKLAHL